jgi:hypothetical protein
VCAEETQVNVKWFRNYKSTTARTGTTETAELPVAAARTLATYREC